MILLRTVLVCPRRAIEQVAPNCCVSIINGPGLILGEQQNKLDKRCVSIINGPGLILGSNRTMDKHCVFCLSTVLSYPRIRPGPLIMDKHCVSPLVLLLP